MKHLFVLLFTFLFISANSQVRFNTGSVELDASLNNINLNAQLDLSNFKADICNDYKVDISFVNYLYAEFKMNSAEVYLVLEISKLSSAKHDKVIECYKKHKNKGWGYIAKQMGIKPGSEKFHSLVADSKGKNSNSAKKHRKGKKNRNKKS